MCFHSGWPGYGICSVMFAQPQASARKPQSSIHTASVKTAVIHVLRTRVESPALFTGKNE